MHLTMAPSWSLQVLRTPILFLMEISALKSLSPLQKMQLVIRLTPQAQHYRLKKILKAL